MKPDTARRLALALLLFTVPLVASPAATGPCTDRRSSIASAGDVNGDGACDVAVAERGAGAVDFLETGPEPPLDRVWILSGKDGELLRTLKPPRGCPAFGRALENVGDWNGDGKDELAVSGGGPLWIFSGADGSVLFELPRDLKSPGFGRSLDGGEDVDGDGVPDLVVYRKAHRSYLPRVGLVLLYSGKTGELLRALGCEPESPRPEWTEAEIYGTHPGEKLSDVVGLVTDRDGNGRAELVVSLEHGKSENGEERPDTLEVLDPWTRSSHQRSELPRGCTWVIRNLGDADGDEVDDVLLSIINYYVLLYSGATGKELRRHDYNGGYLRGEGTSLDVIDDLDGDGVAEYLIGANEEDDVDGGFSILHSGATGEVLQSMIGGVLEEIPDRALPIEARDVKYIGIDTCALGDTNGDGVPDVAVHLPAMEEVRVLSGVDFEALVTVRTSPLLMHNVKK